MILKVNNLSKKFSGKKILKKISFCVEKEKVTAYLGNNGAGKTTTIRSLLGFLKVDSGEIILKTKKVGYVQQEPRFFSYLKGLEIIKYTAKLYNINNWHKKLENLCEKLDFDVSLMKKNTENLSPGERKKLSYIQSLLINPELLIIDEPFASLDPIAIKSVKQIINEMVKIKKTVFLSTHLLNETQSIADNIIILDNGKIIQQSSWSRKKGLEKHFLEIIDKK